MHSVKEFQKRCDFSSPNSWEVRLRVKFRLVLDLTDYGVNQDPANTPTRSAIVGHVQSYFSRREILESGPMVMLILGGVLLGVGGVLDSLFRLRMSRIGHRWALLQGGAFDYSRYHKVREEHGWAAWPVYLMWLALACGITLLVAGFFAYFGTTPRHGN